MTADRTALTTRPPSQIATGLEGLVERIEGSRALGTWGDAVHPVVSKLLGTGRRLELLTGRWLGHPVHPMAVIVPMGCRLSATLLDFVGPPAARPAARRLIGLGLLGAGPALASGAADWRDTADAERRIGVVHAVANNVAVAGYALSWLARRSGSASVGRATGLAAATILGIGGYLGGHLAYRRGVGINTTAFEAGPTDWTDIAGLDDIPVDEPTAVVSDDVVLMVLRRDGQIYVMEDRCTHRGGPLHEGRLERSCIVCPWHDSAFDLATGAVRQGPATMPQPVYDVRVADGRIAVRRTEQGSLRLNPVAPSAVE
ncbi:MAG: Rieske 2Fe-2S domain-containing protein [Ilumatobacteraceae bacterium]